MKQPLTVKRLFILILAASCMLLFSSCGSTNSKTKYLVSIHVVPANGGTVSPASGKYAEGEKLDILASPSDSSWQFDRWSGDYDGTLPSGTVTVTKAMNIIAHFSKKEYKLTVHTKGKGTVEQKVIKNTASTASDYEFGTIVQLTAKPDSGWKFVKWTGDLTGSKNPDQIIVKKPKEIMAVFEKKSFALTIKTEGEGTVSKKPDQKTYEYETKVTLTAEPRPGWKFVKWKGDLSATKNPAEITMAKNKEVTAVFEKAAYRVHTSTQGDGNVIISPRKKDYFYNEEITFKAIANNGYAFIHWQGDLSGNKNPQTIRIKGNTSVEAIFKTYNDALVYRLGGGVYIAGRVYQATLDLFNTLPDSVRLTRVTLKNEKGDTVVQNTDGITIKSGKGVGFTVSFDPFHPTTEVFNQYTVIWKVTYRGHSIVKKDEVGESQKAKSRSNQVAKTFKLRAEIEKM